MPRKTSKYSEQKNSSIRYNIIDALQTMATNRGISIKEMQSTYPYSLELGQLSPQKISTELKKLIDSGVVVRSNFRSSPMRYMLRMTYNEMGFSNNEYGYGDYRDIGDNIVD